MKDSLLIKYWEQLPVSAHQMVVDAAQSPFLNKREDVQQLIDLLQMDHNITKEAAWKALYPTGKPAYHDGQMRHLMNYTLDLIRKALAMSDIRDQDQALQLHLLQAMKQAGMTDLMDKEISRTRTKLLQSTGRSVDYYRHSVELEAIAFEQNRHSKRERTDHTNQLFTDFGTQVALVSLQQGCTKLAQTSFFSSDTEIPYLEETIRLIDAGHFCNSPAVETWFASYQALSDPDDRQRFLQLKACIAEHAPLFPKEELRDLYILALNVCIRRINASDKAYIREAFDIYQAGLKEGVFLENGHLSKFTYRNILNIALALEEWTWANAYLDEYKPYLAPKEQEQIYTYNLATFYFRKGEYDQALILLRDARVTELLEQFDVRRMLVRIYYDRQEIQALDSLLDSFDIYLRRHKKGGYHRKMYMNMVRIMRSLITPTGNIARHKERLLARIDRTEYLAEREWLRGQVV